MRIARLIAVFCLSVTIAGCAQANDRSATIVLGDSDDATVAFGDYLSARFAANHHDLTEAAKYYSDSLDHDPDNRQIMSLAFFYAASAGKFAEAAKLADQVAKFAPDDRAARLMLAVAEFKQHDYRAARAEINKSAKGPFTAFTVALIDAWAAAGEGDGKTAAADMKILHAQHAADGLAYFNEAMLAELLGHNDDADTAYGLALKTAGPTPRVVDAYGRFLERNGRAKEALAMYATLNDDSGFAPVVGPGQARIAKGINPDPLIVHAEDGAAEALFGIAASLNDESNRDISILYLRLALFLRPQFDLANLLLGERFEGMQKYEDAIRLYQEVAQDSPYYRLAAVEMAVDLTRLDRTDKAIADLTDLAKAYPNDIEAWTALGDAYRAAEKYSDAANAYSQAIRIAGTPVSKSWPLYYARAIALQQADNWKGAEADLRLALQLSPDEPQVLNFLGYTWVDKHEHIPQALVMLEKARTLAPQDGYIVDSVGWAYYRLGRYGEAAKTLEDAVQLVPGDPTINDHLGDAYWKVGRKLDARFQWSHALAFGADGGEKDKIEKKLQVGLKGDDRS